MGYPDTFWEKQIRFVCTDCRYAMTTVDHKHIERKWSEIHETDMDFFTCPQCGKEAIVLW